MKPYITFCGYNLNVIVNENHNIEITNIKYDDLKKEIYLTAPIFSYLKTDIRQNRVESVISKLSNSKLEQFFCHDEHEYDSNKNQEIKSYRLFSGVYYKSKKGECDVNDVSSEEVYTLGYESVTPLFDIPFGMSHDDVRESIKQICGGYYICN